MRLSEWSAVAPTPGAVAPKVMAIAGAALATLGFQPDADCWITWGDDPTVRWVVLAITPAGLAMVHVRVNVPQEGPRAAGKLIRWSRVQLGEVAVEAQGAHRLISATVEGIFMRGADSEADAVSAFLQGVLAAVDGRPLPDGAALDPAALAEA